jgi:leucyl-tRNA synthetase
VQVNGKLRGTLQIEAAQSEDKNLVEELAKKDEGVAKFLQGQIHQIIYVPGKVLNFVVS